MRLVSAAIYAPALFFWSLNMAMGNNGGFAHFTYILMLQVLKIAPVASAYFLFRAEWWYISTDAYWNDDHYKSNGDVRGRG